MKIQPENCARYETNPLIEVVAQFRFQPILAIGKEGPVAVQEALADAGFPNLRKEEPASISVTFRADSVQGAGAPNVPPPVLNSSGTIYHFASPDFKQTFSACATFVAFTTTSYNRWTDFQEKLGKLANIFAQAYKPIVVNRVGLRYKDLIERESLGLDGVSWGDLLNPIVSGIFSTDSFVDDMDELSVEQQASQTLMTLHDCNLLLQSALLRSTENDKQRAFLIDSDFFLERSNGIDVPESIQLLDTLHTNANSVFRKCIKEPLHAALHPVESK
ncbi:TIGR04255 family protein [Paraburkholderia sediminicola]|uniref:TIGR04255 family protein n=1 Tax=Paraburkholderia sediminicola TaxID=458836 RepID=UPI0038B6BB4B